MGLPRILHTIPKDEGSNIRLRQTKRKTIVQANANKLMNKSKFAVTYLLGLPPITDCSIDSGMLEMSNLLVG